MILDTSEFRVKLFECLQESQTEVIILSAFIKLDALLQSELAKFLKGKSVKFVARWQKNDLISGASDLEVYEYCKTNGWQFGVSLNLHGKVYLVDRQTVFIGSANFTSKGLNLCEVSNNEFGICYEADALDVKKIHSFIDSEVVWVDDKLFYMLNSMVDCPTMSKTESWPSEIACMLSRDVEFLWVHEMFLLSPFELFDIKACDKNDLLHHDLKLLGSNINGQSLDEMLHGFRQTKVYSWLRHILLGNSLSFGGVTARLHNSLLDSPKPYRSDVKLLVKNIFDWCSLLEEFKVEKARYSSILSLTI